MSGQGIVLFTLLSLLLVCRVTFAEICRSAVCHYEFRIRLSRTMVYRTQGKAFNVQLNGSKLQVANSSYHLGDGLVGKVVRPEEVITADGFERDIIVINDQFPGPSIEVMEGAQVIVKVINDLETWALTIHWHGLYVKDTPWMDGVPFVSQCPIGPKRTFVYRFLADPPGTHFYHGHFGLQRADGLWGFLVVHRHQPQLPTFLFSVQDWFHQLGDSIDSMHGYRLTNPGTGDLLLPEEERGYSADNIELSAMRYQSALLNGRGRFQGASLPLAHFNVDSNQRYLFRAVHAGLEFSFKVSIDAHELLVVASDGNSVQPIKVDYLLIHPGERFDFEVVANQKPDTYWIRAQTLKKGIGKQLLRLEEPDQVRGILVYTSASAAAEPTSSALTCSEQRQCIYFNCPFQGTKVSEHIKCISLNDAKSTLPASTLHQRYGTQESDIEQIVLNFGFNIGSCVNAVRFVPPKSPYYANYEQGLTKCDPEQCRSGCACTQRLRLPYNKTIQLVVTNLQPAINNEIPSLAHHVVHMHGHSFAVLKQAFPPYNSSTGFFSGSHKDVSCESSLCRLPRLSRKLQDLNLLDPPIKDTVIVPARGYVVIRFRTDNPGYWPLHCHQDTHFIEGMQILIEEATERVASPPANFPRCPDFDPLENDQTEQRKTGTDKRYPLKFSIAGFVGISCGLLLLGTALSLLVLKTIGKHFERKVSVAQHNGCKRKLLVSRRALGGGERNCKEDEQSR